MATCYKLEVVAINAATAGIGSFIALNEVASVLHGTELYYDTEADLAVAVKERVKAASPDRFTGDRHALRIAAFNVTLDGEVVRRKLAVDKVTRGGLEHIGTIDLSEGEVVKYFPRTKHDRYFSRGGPVDMEIVKRVYDNAAPLPTSIGELGELFELRGLGYICDHDTNTDVITVTSQFGDTGLFIARQYHRN